MRTVPARRPPRRAVAVVAGALSTAVVAGACAGAPTAAPAVGPDGDDVVVAAASSLSTVVADLGAAWRRSSDRAAWRRSSDRAAWRRSADRVDDTVTLDTASSSTLALRLAEGAPYDVFAAADLATMRRLRDDGLLADEPHVFARTTLVLVTAAGNPAGVRTLADLARPDLRVALAAPSVPLGRYTREALARSGTDAPPRASRETNARAVLAKVRLGEADAGVVYRPDAATDGALQTVELPTAAQVTVEYPIAVPVTTDDRGAADDFVRFVLSPQGRAVLVAAGYEVP